MQSRAKHSRKDQRQVLLRALHGLNTGKDFLLAQTPKVYVTRPHWSSSCSCSQKHTCSTVLWLKMRAPKCSRPEPNKPSQTHEHGLSKEKKVSFQISIFLSPAVLAFIASSYARLFQLLQASLVAPSLSQSNLPKLRKKATNNSKGWPPIWGCKNQRAHGPARGSSPVFFLPLSLHPRFARWELTLQAAKVRKGSSWPPDKGIGVGATLEGRRCDFELQVHVYVNYWSEDVELRLVLPPSHPPPDNVGQSQSWASV